MVNRQLDQLLRELDAQEIRETEDRIHFKIGKRQKEICKEFPLIFHVEVSSHCNLSCLGCPQKDLTPLRQFMEPELFRKIVDEISDYGSRAWLHYMGEPLSIPKYSI